MKPEDILKMLETLIGGQGEVKMVDGREKHDKVVRSFPAKPEWVKDWTANRTKVMELELMTDALKKKFMELSTYRSAFWAKVEIDMGVFDKHLRFNEDTKEIEVLE